MVSNPVDRINRASGAIASASISLTNVPTSLTDLPEQKVAEILHRLPSTSREIMDLMDALMRGYAFLADVCKRIELREIAAQMLVEHNQLVSTEMLENWLEYEGAACIGGLGLREAQCRADRVIAQKYGLSLPTESEAT